MWLHFLCGGMPRPPSELIVPPNFMLKIIPHVNGTARICELVRYFRDDVTDKGAWTGPAALKLSHHALAPVSPHPVF